MTGHLGLTDWSFEPSVTAGLCAVVAAYTVARRRGLLAASDDVTPWMRSPRTRTAYFALGVATGFLALDSPIDVGGDRYLLSLHMVQHLLLMMVAPPLVLLGVAGIRPPGEEVVPRLRAAWTWVTRPWPATILFNAVLMVWHIPALYDATLRTEPIHVVEHLTFVAVGVVFWWPIVDPVRRSATRPVGPFSKIAMLVIAGIPPTALGFVFALGGSAYYDFYAQAPRLWGMSAVADQQVAGVIMFGLGNLIYFVAVSVVFLRMFGNPADDEAEIDTETAAPAETGADLTASGRR